MQLQKFSSELQELTVNEANQINGGETLWYWFSYAIGGVIYQIATDVKAASNGTYQQSAGSAAMHSALG